MSKGKSSKKHKNNPAAKAVPAPLNVVQTAIPEEEPAGRKTPVFSVILKISAMALATLLLLWAGAFILRRQPLSNAYSLSISTSSFVFRVGDEGDISYFFKHATDIPFLLRLQEDKRGNVRFESSDETVVAVDDKGHLSAVGSGVADVTVRVEDMSKTVQVVSYDRVSALSFPENSYEIKAGERLSLEAQKVPEDAVLYEEITYSLSDETVLSFDTDGLLLAAHPGTCVVRAEAEGLVTETEVRVIRPVTGASIKEDIRQSVEEIEHSTQSAFRGVIVSEGAITLREGLSHDLHAAILPSFTQESRGILWWSDDPDVASVDANGSVRAVSTGTARIYAIHGQTASSCQVTVRMSTERDLAADRIIAFGSAYQGTPYVYGGNSLTGGLDCSSFTKQCFATEGIRLPRSSAEQALCGTAVSMDMSQWLPGDLIFYAPYGFVSHVAIYIGNGQILHSAESMGGVCITSVCYCGIQPCSVRRVF